MSLQLDYTTEDKKAADIEKPVEEQTEQLKTIISNDAFAIVEYINKLTKEFEKMRIN